MARSGHVDYIGQQGKGATVQFDWSENWINDGGFGTSEITISNIQCKTREGTQTKVDYFVYFGINLIGSDGTRYNFFTPQGGNYKLNLQVVHVYNNIVGPEGTTNFTRTVRYKRTTSQVERVQFEIIPSDGFLYATIKSRDGKYTHRIYSETEGPSASLKYSIDLDENFTNPIAPTSIWLEAIQGQSKFDNGKWLVRLEQPSYGLSTGKVRLRWSGAADGTNNPITGYTVYYGPSVSSMTAGPTTTNNYYDLSGGDVGDTIYYQIKAVGRYSNSGLSPITLEGVKKNTPPANDLMQVDVYESYNAVMGSLIVKSTSNKEIYWALPNSNSYQKYSEDNTWAVASEYKFKTFDGLNLSNDTSTFSVKRANKPRIESFTKTVIEGLSYDKVHKYYTSIEMKDIQYTTNPVSLKEYRLYRKIGDNKVLVGSYDHAPFSYFPSEHIPETHSYGISVISSIGDESDIKWDTTELRTGMPLMAQVFQANITIDGRISNTKNVIEGAQSSCFNKYIRFSWNNPIIESDVVYYPINKIQFGYVSTGSFYEKDSIVGSNQYVGESIDRFVDVSNLQYNTTYTPAVRIFSGKNNENFTLTFDSLTRVGGSLNVTGITTMSEFSFYNELDISGGSISFMVNGVTEEFKRGSAAIPNPTIEIRNSLLTKSYTGFFGTIPGVKQIEFNDLDIFKADLKNLGKATKETTTYTIMLTDVYGDSFNYSASQIIDFTAIPIVNSMTVTYGDVHGDLIETGRNELYPQEKIKVSNLNAKDALGSSMKYSIRVILKDGTELVTNPDSSSYAEIEIPQLISSVDVDRIEAYAFGKSNISSAAKRESSDKKILASMPVALSIDYEVKDNKLYFNLPFFNENHLLSKGCLVKVKIFGVKQEVYIPETSTGYAYVVDNLPSSQNGKYSFDFIVYPAPYKDNKDEVYEDDFYLSTAHYVYVISGPTFSYRKHQIGINSAPVDGAALTVSGYIDKEDDGLKIKKVVLISPNDIDNGEVDLSTMELINFIIDGGTW